MALTAIVPSNRNSGTPCPELVPAHVDAYDTIDDIPFAMSSTPAPTDPLLALAVELMADECLTPLEALSQALCLLDDLDAYAAVWDATAFVAGNPDVYPAAPEPVPIAA